MKGTDGMKRPSSHTEFLSVFEAWEKRRGGGGQLADTCESAQRVLPLGN